MGGWLRVHSWCAVSKSVGGFKGLTDIVLLVCSQQIFGADKERWPKVMGALKKGKVADGEVTLVLERKIWAGLDDPQPPGDKAPQAAEGQRNG